MYKLVAEFEGGMTKDIGTFANMAEAAEKIEKIDNEECDEYVGSEMVLTDVLTGRQWFYTDTWEDVL
jgi:hypothetical protein